MTTMSTTRQSEEWDGKAPWNPQWFWPQAILFGFGAAGIVAGLNYRRLGRPRLMRPTIVISSVVFIGILAGLAFVDRGYVVVTAIIINAFAALILVLLKRADYNSFKERMPNGVNGGLDLLVMIGLTRPCGFVGVRCRCSA
jgi:peptidoglycan/LPS O-acetylase OafA/YrhL